MAGPRRPQSASWPSAVVPIACRMAMAKPHQRHTDAPEAHKDVQEASPRPLPRARANVVGPGHEARGRWLLHPRPEHCTGVFPCFRARSGAHRCISVFPRFRARSGGIDCFRDFSCLERRIGGFPCFRTLSSEAAYFPASAPQTAPTYRRVSSFPAPEQRTGV